MPNAKKGKQAARRERVAVMRAQQKRAERRRNLITIGAIAAVAAVIIGVVVRYAVGRGGGNSASTEVIPPGVGGGSVTVQAPTHQVPNTSGIPGVIEYITTGWPQTSNNGPAAQALAYDHVTGPFVEKQTEVSSAEGASSRYMDLTPYPGLPSPIVISSWGFQLKVSSPADPRLQQFVNKFRASPTYTPEYGSACTGGVGTPLQK